MSMSQTTPIAYANVANPQVHERMAKFLRPAIREAAMSNKLRHQTSADNAQAVVFRPDGWVEFWRYEVTAWTAR